MELFKYFFWIKNFLLKNENLEDLRAQIFSPMKIIWSTTRRQRRRKKTGTRWFKILIVLSSKRIEVQLKTKVEVEESHILGPHTHEKKQNECWSISFYVDLNAARAKVENKEGARTAQEDTNGRGENSTWKTHSEWTHACTWKHTFITLLIHS